VALTPVQKRLRMYRKNQLLEAQQRMQEVVNTTDDTKVKKVFEGLLERLEKELSFPNEKGD